MPEEREPQHAPLAKEAFDAAIREGWCEIGDHTYGAPDVKFVECGSKLRIGKFCSIGQGVRIYLGGEHRADFITTYPFASFDADWPEAAGLASPLSESKGDVVIGNDVWIGDNVTILSGVTIHDGAVIGAGSYVTRDVFQYQVMAGNPLRYIRRRVADWHLEPMLEIAWWNWPVERIKKNLPLLLSNDIEAFIKANLPEQE